MTDTTNGLGPVLELGEVADVVEVHTRIVVDPDLPIIFRPADLRVIRAMTGRDLTAMISDESYDADRFCGLAFIQLRRQYPNRGAKELWELVEEADLEMMAPREDPTGGGTSTVSPPSATTGV